MSGTRSSFSLLALLLYSAAACTLTATGADDPPRMTTQELKQRLGDPGLIVIDVRAGTSWTESDSKIKGAVRETPDHVQDWIKKYPRDKTLVFYCS